MVTIENYLFIPLLLLVTGGILIPIIEGGQVDIFWLSDANLKHFCAF